MNQSSSSQGKIRAKKSEKRPHAVQETLKGEWMAPIIAWVAVITLGLAIVGLLLGQE